MKGNARSNEIRLLGYTFGQCYSPKTGRTYLGTVPSRKRVKRICEAISELTGRDQILLDQEVEVARLNRVLTGWANYFCLGPVSQAYRAVDQYADRRKHGGAIEAPADERAGNR